MPEEYELTVYVTIKSTGPKDAVDAVESVLNATPGVVWSSVEVDAGDYE